MKQGNTIALALASRLLAYPDKAYLEKLPALKAECQELVELEPEFTHAAIAFIELMLVGDIAVISRSYVEIFDFTAPASLYMTWHRYGNDRSQGQAMAALNGLYRTAGFEPLTREMPDYLPRMLEFLSIAPDWAVEVLLDGFGAEIQGVLERMGQMQAPHVHFLAAALKPLKDKYSCFFQPRQAFDPTRRPLANPAPEPSVPLLASTLKLP